MCPAHCAASDVNGVRVFGAWHCLTPPTALHRDAIGQGGFVPDNWAEPMMAILIALYPRLEALLRAAS